MFFLYTGVTVSAISLVIPVSTSFVPTFVTVFVLFCWINKLMMTDDVVIKKKKELNTQQHQVTNTTDNNISVEV